MEKSILTYRRDRKNTIFYGNVSEAISAEAGELGNILIICKGFE